MTSTWLVGRTLHMQVGITTSMMPAGPTLARFKYLRLPPSRVVRYTIPSHSLTAWTRKALRELDARARSRRGDATTRQGESGGREAAA